jgi:hypothetical protein
MLKTGLPATTPAHIASLHTLSRPQQQGWRSVNPFTLVPAVPSDALRVNAVGGSEGGAVIAKKLEYALAPDIESQLLSRSGRIQKMPTADWKE